MADYYSAQPPTPSSPQTGRHTDSTSQVTACHRCRKQKVGMGFSGALILYYVKIDFELVPMPSTC
jgi:hypothetical protein